MSNSTSIAAFIIRLHSKLSSIYQFQCKRDSFLNFSFRVNTHKHMKRVSNSDRVLIRDKKLKRKKSVKSVTRREEKTKPKKKKNITKYLRPIFSQFSFCSVCCCDDTIEILQRWFNTFVIFDVLFFIQFRKISLKLCGAKCVGKIVYQEKKWFFCLFFFLTTRWTDKQNARKTFFSLKKKILFLSNKCVARMRTISFLYRSTAHEVHYWHDNRKIEFLFLAALR